MQEIGETRDAIIEEDNKLLQEILAANKSKKDPYWIVLFAKPSKVMVDGKPTLMKFMKAYSRKPNSQVGMCVGRVNNNKGTIDWEVNMPQAPINYDKLLALGAQESNEVVKETTTIGYAYVTK